MDHLKMLEDINGMVSTDFCELMYMNRVVESEDYNPFSKKDSEEMADILGKVYRIAHSIHCKACGGRYSESPTEPK